MEITIEDPFFLETLNEFLSDPYYCEIDAHIAHGGYSVLEHCLHVASLSYLLAKRSKKAVDLRALLRGAMLHDFYRYDWHLPHKGHRLHGFRHPAYALKLASERYSLSPLERRLIKNHMWPLTFWRIPLSKEERILCHADRLSAFYEHRYAKGKARPTLYEYAFGGKR